MAEELDNNDNYEAFRDSVFTSLIAAAATPFFSSSSSSSNNSTRKKPAQRRRPAGSKPASSGGTNENKTKSTAKKTTRQTSNNAVTTPSNDPSELADFSDYIAGEMFPALPQDLRTLSYTRVESTSNKERQNKPNLPTTTAPTTSPSTTEKYSLPLSSTLLESLSHHLPPTVPDTLLAYNLITPPHTDLTTFLSAILTTYITTVTITSAPPKIWSSTRTSSCEICDRHWVPLTYHHLIPKAVHAKVLKRGWHSEDMLGSVAWLCRACHTFVHRMASNEELAREWFTVERICERDDTRRWAEWVGRVRWSKS